MGLAPRKLKKSNGLTFFKLMGSGGNQGFSLTPNFGLYSLLMVWEKEEFAHTFFQENNTHFQYKSHASACQTVFLQNSMSHGLWDNKNPFQPTANFDPAGPLAVLTRATIKLRYIPTFWKFVPGVSRHVEDKPGLRFAIGIGELPILLQATFSLWDSGTQMIEFAYKTDEHREMINKTRTLGWYKEELFARFVPYKTLGSGIWPLTNRY